MMNLQNVFRNAFLGAMEKKAKKNYMSFPRSEHKALKARIEKMLDIITTRILKDRNQYQQGDIIDTALGTKLKVKKVTPYSSVEKHPYYTELTKPQVQLLKKVPYEVLLLRSVMSKNNKDALNDKF